MSDELFENLQLSLCDLEKDIVKEMQEIKRLNQSKQEAPIIPKSEISSNFQFSPFNASKYEFSTNSKRDSSYMGYPRETQITVKPTSPQEKSSMLHEGVWESLLYTERSPIKENVGDRKKGKSKKPQSRVAKSTQNLLEKYEAAKERTKKQSLASMEECSFRPLLSKKSLKMASRMEDAKSRLIEDNRFIEREERLKEKMRKECPFKPSINGKSQVLDARSKSGNRNVSRFEVLFAENRAKEEELEARRMINQREQDFDENLTFKPKILPRSQRAASVFTGVSKKPLPSRSMEWKRMRDEKIQQAQENKELEEEQSCTFRPSVSPDIGWRVERPAELSDFGKKGLVQYIERVDNARKKKQEKESSNSRYGSKWSNRITVPHEFSLKSSDRHSKGKAKQKGQVLVLVDGPEEKHVEEKSMSIDYVPMKKPGADVFEYALYNLHQKLHAFNF